MKEISPETLLDTLVDFADGLRFEDIPKEVIDEAKRRLIDAIGCAIGGSRDPALEITKKALSNFLMCVCEKQPGLYGKVLGGSTRPISLPEAGYANTHMIRVLDWNDTYLSIEPAHPSDNIGAILALSEMREINGKDFLTAMVLAYEIQCRFCDAASLRKRGWDHTNYVTVASSLAAAKLIGLSKEQMKNAVSLALSTGIIMRQGRVGQLSHEKGALAGSAVRSALWGVIRALNEFTGPEKIFEGECAFIKLIPGELRMAAFEKLGESYKLPATYIKPYPVEYHAQAVVEAGLKLRKQLQAQSGSDPVYHLIKKVEIESYEAARSIIGDPEKRRPQTRESADHSIYYVLAAALIDGYLGLGQYELGRFKDGDILALIRRMEDAKEGKEYNKAYRRQEFPAKVTVHTKSGKSFSVTIDNPTGHPKRPMRKEDLWKKFNGLSRLVFPGEEKRRELFNTLSSLEKITDMKSIEALWNWGKKK